MKIDDVRLEKLGVYFVHQEIYKKYGVTFERFVYYVVNNMWKGVINHV